MRTSILLLLALAGCVPTPYRLGVKAASNGQFYEASQHWLTALDEDIYASKPRARLAEHSRDAWNAQWSLAQEHEASGRYGQAVEVFQQMFAFEQALKEVELLDFATDEVHDQHREAVRAWAGAEREAAAAADARGEWEVADVHYRKVRELTPEAEGLDAQQGLSLRMWAEKDLKLFRYAQAAEHFRQAAALRPDAGSEAWASAVEAALGRYALAQDRCRAAVDWFERAGHVVGDPELPADRARAEDCARIGVVVEPVSEEAELKVGGMALGSMFADLLEERVGTAGSRFVRMLSSEALDGAVNPPARRVRITGRITQASLEDPVVHEARRVIEGEGVTACDKETLRLDPEALCTEAAEVRYVEHRTVVTVRLAGSVKVVDLVSGEQQTRPLELAVEHEVLHATDFERVIDGVAIPIRVGPTAEVGRTGVPPEVASLDSKPPPLPAEGQRVADAVKTLAVSAADAVLAVVDTEPELAPPARLEVRAPKVLPEDLGFGEVAPPPPPVERPTATIELIGPEPVDPLLAPADPPPPVDTTAPAVAPPAPPPDAPPEATP